MTSSTSSAPWVSRSRYPKKRSPAPWWEGDTAVRRCSPSRNNCARGAVASISYWAPPQKSDSSGFLRQRGWLSRSPSPLKTVRWVIPVESLTCCPAILERTKAEVIYACGPMGMLSAVAALAPHFGAHSQCAVEEAMACGIGVCMTCVLPVVGDDGVTRMVRSCVEGPVFRGEQVRWGDVGTVPTDTHGAINVAAGGGAH